MSRRLFIWFIWAVTFLFVLINAWLFIKLGSFSVNDLSGFLFVIGSAIIGSLIIEQRPQNSLGWLFSGIGLLWAISNTLLVYVNYLLVFEADVGRIVPWLGLTASVLSDMAWVIAVTFLFLLFPNGHFPSPRWRIVGWTTAVLLTVGLPALLFTPGPLSQLPHVNNPLGDTGWAWLDALGGIVGVILFLCICASLTSIFARYTFANASSKRQIKIVAFFSLLLAFLYIAPEFLRQLGANAIALIAALNFAGALAFGLFPFVIGVAVLRYHLFDIDVIIRKTLVYAVLTSLLALVYFGDVIFLQSLFDAVSGEQSPIAVVISTLVIAALFNPLRGRVQAFIDRRFYRQKYDAQQVLADFAHTARDETDMDVLQAELLKVVQEAMQPKTISIWLKQ